MNRRKEIQANLSACDLTEDRRALYFSPQIKSQGHGTFSFMLEMGVYGILPEKAPAVLWAGT